MRLKIFCRNNVGHKMSIGINWPCESQIFAEKGLYLKLRAVWVKRSKKTCDIDEVLCFRRKKGQCSPESLLFLMPYSSDSKKLNAL